MPTAKNDDVGEAEVQHNKDAEDAQGFVGRKVDPTPDAHYTVAGVTSGKPTPESDPERAGTRKVQHDSTTVTW